MRTQLKQNISGEMPTQSDVGSLIQAYRMKSGISADQLADLTDVSSADQILKYEAGEANVPFDDLIAISNVLNIPPDEIIQILHSFYISQQGPT